MMNQMDDGQTLKVYHAELKASTPKDLNLEDDNDLGGTPNQNLSISHVFGFRSVGSKQNVKYSSDNKVVFISAGLGVVMDVSDSSKKQ